MLFILDILDTDSLGPSHCASIVSLWDKSDMKLSNGIETLGEEGIAFPLIFHLSGYKQIIIFT